MGTHPIFESDFDCLTDTDRPRNMQLRFNDTLVEATTTDDVLAMVPAGEMLNKPLQAGFDLEQVGIAPFTTLTTQPGLLGGKVQGSNTKSRRRGEEKGQDWPRQATHAIQPSFRQRRPIIRQEEGSKLKLLIDCVKITILFM